ncbi:cell death-inducing p53-target protein 1 homolog isoform X2 [Gigantopelta aegis]|uniref:cell death-inducing p53-target protein 1 homolog isoform X2 n=1 Tax=Gigantopelta aegis TaxID=1735272 RepID=UPI001B8882C9|nr:cell death-inducing p53-target protein 1 homolog isoform X2 [Gigantopelta aegis]
MSQAPPPYPSDQKGGAPPPAYGPPPAGYGPPPGGQPGYGPPPAQYGYGQPGQYPPTGQPAQPGYYPQNQQATTVVVAQPTIAVVQQYRESPVHTRCPYCQAEVMTGTHYETGTFTWVICLILALVGCWIGCCLIPFCVDGCKDVIHTCPNCRQQVARWSRM